MASPIARRYNFSLKSWMASPVGRSRLSQRKELHCSDAPLPRQTAATYQRWLQFRDWILLRLLVRSKHPGLFSLISAIDVPDRPVDPGAWCRSLSGDRYPEIRYRELFNDACV